MNNDNFLIESSELELVKELCACINEPNKRSNAVANMLAAEVAKKYFTEIELDSVTSLHEIPQLLENIEISDIYIKNNYIDVRLYFENEPLFIPRSHFDNNIAPLAYMFIKVTEDISSATITGFLLSSTIDITQNNNDYIAISEEDLISYYDLENHLVYKEIEDTNEDFDIEIFKYLDNKLETKSNFYNTLINSPEAREKLKNAAKAKAILSFISISQENGQDLLNKEVKLDELNAIETLETNSHSEELIELEEATMLNSDENETIILNMDDDNTLEEVNATFDIESEFDSDGNEFIEIETDNQDNLLNSDSEIFLNEAYEGIQQENNTIYNEFEEDKATLDLFTENNSALEEHSFSNIEETNELINLDNKNDDAEILPIDENEVLISQPEISSMTAETENSNYIIPEETIEELNIPVDDILSPEEEVNTEEIIESEVYSTNTTPSLNSLEYSDNEIINEKDLMESLENEHSVSNSEQTIIEDNLASPEIDTLFHNETNDEYESTSYNKYQQPSKGNPVKLIGILALLGALGYFGYTKFLSSGQINNYVPKSNNATAVKTEKQVAAPKPIPMPNETVENTKNTQKSEEAVSETLPAIESNLDSPVLISNLAVKWEVPASYISSGTAKRYFTKLGKILQLNLKTELLLLSKPPITNKICVELTYNKNNQRFEVKGITASSGDKNIDEIIINTINNALNLNLNMNMGVFENITGNPILEINL